MSYNGVDKTKNGVNKSKRRFLIVATSITTAVGVVGFVTPFLESWTPSEKAKAAGGPVKANISKIQEGQQIVVEWRGKPVFIVRRSSEMLTAVTDSDPLLSDPNSNKSDQPQYTKNKHRSIKPEILILIGVCTHLGCSPKFVPDIKPMDFEKRWKGGYHCPCHGSKFDLAGRVYNGVPAPLNLPIPIHEYISDSVVVIGQDKENS